MVVRLRPFDLLDGREAHLIFGHLLLLAQPATELGCLEPGHVHLGAIVLGVVFASGAVLDFGIGGEEILKLFRRHLATADGEGAVDAAPMTLGAFEIREAHARFSRLPPFCAEAGPIRRGGSVARRYPSRRARCSSETGAGDVAAQAANISEIAMARNARKFFIRVF